MAGELQGWPWGDVGNLTATAMLGWYAWFTATRTIPGLVQVFREELHGERDENQRDRAAFRDELAEERMQRHANHLATFEALQELAAELRAGRE